ncbi:MAG TPA: hypothetical protein VMG08_10395 [Allosphingosinicella sp.]|nr:hypothetical protein [Allosphingosinicella sp.]
MRRFLALLKRPGAGGADRLLKMASADQIAAKQSACTWPNGSWKTRIASSSCSEGAIYWRKPSVE